nr:beta-lactamase family protein [Microcella putealis]
MGFQLDSEARRYLTPTSLGHDGAGGQVAFPDPDHRVGFAFLTNEMEAGDDRATRVVDALREVLVAR